MNRIGNFIPLAALVLVSCSSLQMPPVGDDPRVRAFAERPRESMPFAVCVAPVLVDVEGEAPAEALRFPVHEEMAGILELSRLFGAVRAVEKDPSGALRLPPDADIVLKLRVHRMSLGFEGRNRWFWPNLLLWASFVFPAWWVPDETFSGTVDMEVVAVSARSGVRLGSHTSTVQVRRDLNDFERGWVPLGTVLAPSIFTQGNWKRIAREVLRPAVRLVQLDLARWLDTEFRKRVDSGEITSLSATSFALCAGLSKYESLDLHNLAAPRREARALAGFLADPHLGSIHPDRVLTLVDGEATRPALLKALEATLVRGPRAQDAALVYLSGYGKVFDKKGKPHHAFLTYESEPGSPEGAGLGLRELADVVSRSNSGRVMVVLDAGFAGTARGRAAGPPPLFEVELRGLLSEMVVRGRGFVILVERTGVSEGGDFLPHFTAALAGKADLDGDGMVTGAELREHFTKKPPGTGYTARFFGEDLEQVRIPFARGKTKR